jgi:hypothetical protein
MLLLCVHPYQLGIQPFFVLMSLCRTYASLSLDCDGPRKRTTSFSYPNQPSPFSSSPRPAKVPRLSKQMGSLRRTESYICLPGTTTTSTTTTTTTAAQQKKSTPKVPYNRTLQYYKDQRQRQKAQLNRSVEPITIRIIPEPRSQPPTVRLTPPQPPKPSPTPTASPPTVGKPIVKPPILSAPLPRKSSPLAPSRSVLPCRPAFPRSKPEPDLYRKALTSCLKRSPEGQQFLRMTKKLASSVMNATMELERIVAAQTQREKDVQDVLMEDTPPPPPGLTQSWVVVAGEDWEMVDGAL